MRVSRAAAVATGCVGIVGAGWAAAPKELATLELVAPAASPSAHPGAPTAGPTPAPDPSSPAQPVADATAIDGPVVTNIRGGYQARIIVVDGIVTDVQAVVAGTSASESVAVNARAIPELRARVLEAQTWDVDAVSGASFTSPAFIESLRAAFGDAGL